MIYPLLSKYSACGDIHSNVAQTNVGSEDIFSKEVRETFLASKGLKKVFFLTGFFL